MPPRFGFSSAPVGVGADAAKATPTPAAHNANLSVIRNLQWSPLLVEPDRAEILVQVMARADLPALDIGSVRHDPVPPQQKHSVRLVIKHVFLKFAHHRALSCRIGLAQHLLIEIDLL